MDSSVIALLIKIVQIIQTTVTRINIETILVIILITTIDNTTKIVCINYNSRGNQNYDGFNQNSSYQNNDRDLDQSSSHSDIYTTYLKLQVRMLTQASSLQGPNINFDELSASQSCSSNSSQLGYIQTTPTSVTTLSVVAPQGPSSSNELGNQQGPTSSREVQPLTTSLSSSLTSPASEQSVATPTTNQSSTEPRFPANQTIR